MISFAEMTVSLVAVVTDARRDGRRIIGFGFNSNGRYAQPGLLRERFIPRLVGAPGPALLDETGANLDPARAWAQMMRNEKPGGHGERSVAVGILDMALWDIVAKLEARPLAAVLADRFGNGRVAERVPVYAAGGYYYPGRNTLEVRDEMSRYLALGYTTLKMKIGGTSLAEDLARIEAVLDLVPGGAALAVDANGRFESEAAADYAAALTPHGLRWFEEPGDPLDFALLADVAGRYPPSLATGENLFSAVDARNLLRYGGLRPDRDILQFDPALSYGVVEFLRTLEVMAAHGWPRATCWPHGGHLLNLHLASGLGLGGVESYPAVFAPFGGFADTTPVADGLVGVPGAPGLGLETKAALRPLLEQLTGDLT